MGEQSQQPPPSFSLVRGGLFYRIEQRFRLVRVEPPDPSLRIWIGVVVAFLPLVVLSALRGALYGTAVQLPLVLDLTIWARFVIAMPILVSAERDIDGQLAAAAGQFRTTDLVPQEERRDFEAAITRLERARDSVVPEILILGAAFVFGWFSTRAILDLPVSSWRSITPGGGAGTTAAGYWLDFVSLPLFNFLVMRWLWRMLLWAIFLSRVARLDLHLVPTHPDRAGGLGFLGEVHAVFGLILVPLSATVAARGVQWVQFGGGTVEAFRNGAIAFAVVGLAISLGPLLVFMRKLIVVKRAGLIEYGRLGNEYTSRFDRKWLRDRGDDELLGTGDIQSLADLGNSFGVIDSMRIVPPNLRNAFTIVLSIVLPMVPFLLFIVPLKQVLSLLMQLVAR